MKYHFVFKLYCSDDGGPWDHLATYEIDVVANNDDDAIRAAVSQLKDWQNHKMFSFEKFRRNGFDYFDTFGHNYHLCLASHSVATCEAVLA